MEPTIVNPHPSYPRVGMMEPPLTECLLLARSLSRRSAVRRSRSA